MSCHVPSKAEEKFLLASRRELEDADGCCLISWVLPMSERG